MKKRLFALFLALCLCCALTPAAAFADPDEPEYREADPIDVANAAQLIAALPDGQAAPDANNIIWIPTARMTADITITSADSFDTLGILIVPSGRTLTIAEDANVTAGLRIENGGTVCVQADGKLSTTMGGADAIDNHGVLHVQPGGTLQSQFGGSVHNESDGLLTLDGVFFCGCIQFGDMGSEDCHWDMWFTNEGTVDGCGDVMLYDAYDDEAALQGCVPAELGLIVGDMMDALGQETRFQDWDDINIYAAYVIDEYTDLRVLLNSHRYVRGEEVEGNLDLFITLASNMRMDEYDYLATMARIIIPEDVTLTVSSYATLEAAIDNLGTIIVEPYGTLLTTMGGGDAIINNGSIEVHADGAIGSQKGGTIHNSSTGTLKVDGFLFCKSVNVDDVISAWFQNEGTVNGTGIAVALPVEEYQGAPDTLEERVTAGSQLKAQLGGALCTYIYAETFADLQALNANNAVEGIYLDMPEDQDDNLCRVTADLDLGSKRLCVSQYDLVLENGVTLTAASVEHIRFGSRWARIVVEAAGAASPDALAGGTLIVGGKKLLSGTDASANVVPTRDIAFFSGTEYASHPSTPDEEWLYSLADVQVQGEIPYDLPLLVDGELEIVGDLSAQYVEVRDTITVTAGTPTIQNLNYCSSSKESDVRGIKTSFELDFDLNTGNGYDDIRDHLISDNGKIYLQEDGNDVPLSPTRSGYSFAGWKASSSWESVTAEQLADFTVQTSENGKAYVDQATQFPVRMIAQWNKRSSGGSSSGSSAAAAETTPGSAADDTAVPGTVDAGATVSGSTASVTATQAEIQSAADALDAAVAAEGGTAAGEQNLPIDVSGLSADVNAAALPAAAVSQIAALAADEDSAVEGLNVVLSDATVTLDAEALQTVSQQASSGDEIRVEVDLDVQDLTPAQQATVSELRNTVVLDATLYVGNKKVTDFGGGSVTLRIPYDWNGEGVLRAAFIGDDGSVEVVPARYENGYAILKVSHFSDYVVYTEEALPFSDVADPNLYYYDAVKWALEKGITTGSTATTFSPDASCTRAQMVTFLWRAAGQPAAAVSDCPFTDVSEDAYYHGAVHWALEKGIVKGVSEDLFGPDITCSRAQMVTFLYRYIQSEGGGFVGAWAFPLNYSDASSVPDYAYEAFCYTTMKGIVQGSGDRLMPLAECSRAQIVTILARYFAD